MLSENENTHPNLKKIYCPVCNRFIGKENLEKGRIEIICRNCKNWIVLIAKVVYRGKGKDEND